MNDKTRVSIADLRKDYCRATLSEQDVEPNPILQFSKWFDEAVTAQVAEVNAMSISTVGANGRPSSRIVLIKGVDARGFTWFTNYESRKGQELAHNDHAALLFHWIELERQVRIEGRVEKLTSEESDAYYHSRPLGSRIGAHASMQSRPIADRTLLEKRTEEVLQRYDEHPPRPEFWGGYRLIPDYMEFWQGRASRLHDRIVFTLQGDGSWKRERLQP